MKGTALISSAVLFWGFVLFLRRERTQQKSDSVPLRAPPPSRECRLLQTLIIGVAASAWWLAVVSRLFGWVLALQTFQLVPISRPGVGWQLRMASKTFPKKYLGLLGFCIVGKYQPSCEHSGFSG